MERSASLTPTQQRLLGQLKRTPEPLIFDEGFIDGLIAKARAGFADLSAQLGGERIWVSKYFVAQALACEARHLAPSDFSWTPSTARGFVAHKAVELYSHWQGSPVLADVVDEALARLADEASHRGDFVAGLSEADRAELRGASLERLTRFVQDYPPFDWRAEPITEAAGKWKASECIELTGRAVLVMGRPEGRISTRLIVDFKTGNRSPQHRDDLRFYALEETLQRQVPPRKLATYYFDYAEADVEDVTPGLLESALKRALGAVARHAELISGEREPVLRPSYSCRWCPLLSECNTGSSHLTMLDDDGSQGFDDA